MSVFLETREKTMISFLHNLGPRGRSPPWRGFDAVIWLRSDAVPVAVSGVDPGRLLDRMFPSVPGLQALSAALTLFIFLFESCHPPSSPPSLLCLSKNVNTERIRTHVLYVLYMHLYMYKQMYTIKFAQHMSANVHKANVFKKKIQCFLVSFCTWIKIWSTNSVF